ncbi:c-type cytochrome [Rhodoferax sp.]|uniref:c-type cytochrome n=1 Tax=Rhodoferax sp. TaxID=50421 RepID=UPI00284B0C8A|nr:c-type cytochrome [Rhodoferax sp.]MDR3367561.1 c-type cytochrome [Rhodoferax sp.]
MRLLKPLVATAFLTLPMVTQAELTERQAMLLTHNCVQCHARAATGAPTMGHPESWKTRDSAGEDKLLRSVIEGLGGMPPLGYCAACTEADLRALTRAVAGLKGAQ